MDWHQRGELELIPGEVIQDEYIKAKVAELNDKFRIMACYFDPRFAEDITQSFENDHGIERFNVTQSATHMTAPIDDYERMVIDHKLHHNGHSVLNWQAGHCQVAPKGDKLKVLAKPNNNKDDPRTIDGMVAGVMGLAAELSKAGPQFSDYYENNELEIV